MISLESLGRGLDGAVDAYLTATTMPVAAALIRANPVLLTPAAVRTVLALTDPADPTGAGRAAWLLYRSELHGLAGALREFSDPTSDRPEDPDPELARAHRRLQRSRTADQVIDRLRAVRELAGYADLHRGNRWSIEHQLGDRLLARYRTARRPEDLDDALVLLRRAFSAEQRIGTAEAWGEAEFERYLVDGDPARLARADELVSGVLEQQDPAAPGRPFTLVTYGRVVLELHHRDGGAEQLSIALYAAESAADLAVDPSAAAEVARLAEQLAGAAGRAGERALETAAARLGSTVRRRLDAGR